MRKLGFDRTTMYRGQPDWRQVDELGAFPPNNLEGYSSALVPEARGERIRPIWFSSKRSVANTYTDPYRSGDYLNAEPGVRKFVTRSDRPLIVELGADEWDTIPVQKFRRSLPEDKLKEFDEIASRYPEDVASTNKLAEAARRLGFDSVEFKNVVDSYGDLWDPRNPSRFVSNVRAVFNPNQVRYPTARFDPAQRESADLLAGLALPALFTGGAVANQRKNRED
jgi:hypothetical protein